MMDFMKMTLTFIVCSLFTLLCIATFLTRDLTLLCIVYSISLFSGGMVVALGICEIRRICRQAITAKRPS